MCKATVPQLGAGTLFQGQREVLLLNTWGPIYVSAMSNMLLELEDEALGMLFPSASSEQTTASFTIKHDTYSRLGDNEPRDLNVFFGLLKPGYIETPNEKRIQTG